MENGGNQLLWRIHLRLPAGYDDVRLSGQGGGLGPAVYKDRSRRDAVRPGHQ
jgi:hypothetical protein